MTYKTSMEISSEKIDEFVDQLSLRDKIRLARRLAQETWPQRMTSLFKRIDARRKKSKTASREFWDEVQRARLTFYGRRSR